jgi:hypothetical protein
MSCVLGAVEAVGSWHLYCVRRKGRSEVKGGTGQVPVGRAIKACPQEIEHVCYDVG